MNLIIGAGPVGIYLAKKLLDLNLEVTLIDAGYEKVESKLLNRTNYKFNYPSTMPQGVHRVGGGSNYWQGRFGEFLDIDFSRDWFNQNHRWPVSKDELQPHYDAIAKFFAEKTLRDVDFLAENFRDEITMLGKFLNLRLFRFSNRELFIETFNKLSINSNFKFIGGAIARKYSENDGFCTLLLEKEDGSFTELVGKKIFLTCGAISMTNLVMSNLSPQAKNYAGQLLIEHIELFVGKVLVSKRKKAKIGNIFLDYQNRVKDLNAGVGIMLSEELNHQHNFPLIHFEFRPYFNYFVGNQTSMGMKERICRNIKSRFLRFVKIPICKAFGFETFGVWVKAEEIPDFNSRISFDENRNLILYNRRTSPQTRKKLLESIFFLANQIKESIGLKIKLDSRLEFIMGKENFANWHPMGTLRWSTNDNFSVVDEQFKIKGMKNIFILGSALFASGSNSNPTYTSLALCDYFVEKKLVIL